MSRIKRWLLILVGGALASVVLYVLFALLFIDFVVDLWWFGSLGYTGYFWLRLSYRYLLFGAFTLLFFLIFFLNFWTASRFLGRAAPDPTQSPAVSRARALVRKFRSGSLLVYTPFSFILGVVLALPFFRRWEDTLLFLFAPKSGVTDPVFGKDISYYLFSLPLYLAVLDTLVITLSLLFLGILFLYWLERRLLAQIGMRLARGAKLHLSVLVFLIFFVGIWDFLLQRHSLLYSTSHAGLFYGPGFVEMQVILPLIWLSLLLLFGTSVCLVYYINLRRGLKYLLLTVFAFALVLAGRYSSFLPEQVEQYIVKPNEISREKPYIEKSIRSTLAAYGLDKVEHQEYPIGEEEWDLSDPRVKINLRNVPVWDKEVLKDVYQQLQELRTYYRFSTVSVDRYTVNGVYQQVFLAPRELSLKDLPAGVRNWINERLKYTHGHGAVMTPAAQGGEEPMTWFIMDIPAHSDYGFKVAQPGIYFGMLDNGYVIAPNGSREIDYPIEAGNQLVDYQGRDGVPIHSLFQKLIFSSYFKDKDIFFTTKTEANSRILFRRQIVDRIKTITPFFLLDGEPYLVVTPKTMVWIQDAYTHSNRYPYAQPYDNRLNYIRNSVKIVVDAYHGTVDYYLSDPKDPIIQAYRRMYPGLIKTMDEVPAELKSHLRYPKDLFDIQMEIYAKYHQTDPEIFYKQEDLWEFPEMGRGSAKRMKPYFLTLNLIDNKKFEFMLVCPMTPKARSNLRSLCVVGCDGDNYGRILVYNFPKGAMAYGPSQVDAFIDQDTRISEQFTLWNQLGSQVERGRMVLLPVGKTIVYIQPVYLKAAAGVKIPQLKRLLLNKGEITIMEPSLEEGLVQMEKRLKELAERARQRMERYQSPAETQVKSPPPPGPSGEPPVKPSEPPVKPPEAKSKPPEPPAKAPEAVKPPEPAAKAETPAKRPPDTAPK